MVVYDLSEPSDKHGAQVNELFFQGYPLQGRENRYVAFIALPWDTDTLHGSKIVAYDMAGNEVNANFSMILKKMQKKVDRINVSDGFLNSKIPEFKHYYPEMSGSMLEQFLYANGEIRRKNVEAIKEVCNRSVSEQLWQGRFLRISGKTMAGYANQLTYYYNREAVDNQVHLGVDITSAANSEIKAANRGKVAFADHLGIYGNTVILDHGQGVFSLYSHLSRIDVALGDIIEQGAVIAYSGATGMAYGDYLHFSLIVNGIFVNPIEWWDQQWIDQNIKNILAHI